MAADDSRNPEVLSSPAAAGPGVPAGPAIPPLNVTGLVVAKADLIAALRIYVPQLADIVPLDNGSFVLSLSIPPGGSTDEGGGLQCPTSLPTT